MASPERISIIGAGSAQFSMDLVRDISLTEGLQGSQVVFMDVDKERLSLVQGLARRFIEEVGADIRFESTTDRTGAITDSRYVINTALAGSHDQMEKERETQQRNGYYHGIAVHAPHRQLELMHKIAQDVDKYAGTDAYLIQVSNPLPEGCTLMARETGFSNIIGLCDGYLVYKDIVRVLGLSEEDITFEAIGINHNIWMTKFKVGEEDAYPLIDEWIRNQSKEYWHNWYPHHTDNQMSPAAIDLYKMYGLMPIGDTCRASWPEAWWYHTDEKTKERWWGPDGGYDGEKGWKLHLEWLENRVKEIREVANDCALPVTRIFPPKKSNEQIAPIMDAISNDKVDIFQVNIQNNGNIPGLPNDFFVEVPAEIDRSGVHKMQIEKLPQSILLGVLIPRWLFAERLIEAYRTGDYKFVLQAYLADNRTYTREQAEKTIYDVANLPGNEAMAKHFDAFIKSYSSSNEALL